MDLTQTDIKDFVETTRDIVRGEISKQKGNIEQTAFGKIIAINTDTSYNVQITTTNEIYTGLFNKSGIALSLNDVVIIKAPNGNFGNGYISVKSGAFNQEGGGGGGGGAVDSVNGRTGNVVLNKSDVGLGNADNTSDLNKPISTDAQNALNRKLSLSGGVMAGQIDMGNSNISNLAMATSNLQAVNFKQLNDAIDGLGAVFTLKGTKATVADLPPTGNVIGDVWYVESESVGYIWLQDTSGILRWEKFGETIDTSLFVTKSDLLQSTGQITDNTMSQKAITDIVALKLSSDGDGSNLTNTFTQSAARANLTTGEKLSISLGKIMKWFADLKTLAFTGSFSDILNKPTTLSGYGITDGATTAQGNKADTAAQTAKLGTEAVVKVGTELQFPVYPTALPPTGAASGNLSGTYPNPIVETAKKLTTARNINGVPFDGTVDITIPSSGVSDTAKKLETPRAINGTNFDGTADITTSKWGAARTISLTGGVTGTASIDGSANVSIATTTTAADNSYIETLWRQAQNTMGGGGTVTWSGTHLKWTARFICIPVDKKIARYGNVQMNMPPTGTVIEGLGGSPSSTVDVNGIPLITHTALIARYTFSGSIDNVTYHIVAYNNNILNIFLPNDILVAAKVESNIIKLGNGQTITTTSQLTNGNYDDKTKIPITGGNNLISGSLGFTDASRYWIQVANNWGIYWSTGPNIIEFHGAGIKKASIDLNTGDIISARKVIGTNFEGNTQGDKALRTVGAFTTQNMFPIDRGVSNAARANRIAFMPAEQITVENSIDNGITWTDAGLTDKQKIGLFASGGNGLYYHVIGGAGATFSVNNKTRVTIIPWNLKNQTERYCEVDTFYAYYGASGNRINTKIERSTINAKDTFVTMFDDARNLNSGWSNHAEIWFPPTTFGGSATQGSNGFALRFTFSSVSTSALTNLQSVTDLRMYGNWTNYSSKNLSRIDTIYQWDIDQNVTFPAKVLGVTASTDASNKELATTEFVKNAIADKLWFGTTAQYNAIVTKNPNTVYLCS